MLSRTRSETCLSDLRLDELRAGELASADEAAARAHLDGCPICAARLSAIDGHRASFGGAPPAVRQAIWRGRSAAVGVAVAIAAAMVLLVPRSRPSATRTKGGAHLGLFVTSEGKSRSGGAGDKVRPGDTLTFTVSTPARAHVAILSRDGAGNASVYYPVGTAAAVPIAAGTDQLLPTATVLDDVVGVERLFCLFCAGAVPLEPLRRTLAATGELAPPEGCSVDVLAVEKAR